MDVRPLLAQLEAEEEPEAALAYLAAQSVRLDRDEVSAALRRSLLLLAAGGDPRRELEPGGRAVRSLAADIDAPGPRLELAAALAALRRAAAGLPSVSAALDRLLAEPERAWLALACALLAEELGGAGE